MRVLLVEDEIRLAENVAHALRDGPGFAVDHAEDGQTALDLGENPCSERASIIQLLNCDADDYLSKPFDLGEVIARAKALIRRGEGMASPALRLGDLALHTGNQSVFLAGNSIVLSPMEYRILEYVMHRPCVITSKQELLEHMCAFNWIHRSNVIEAHVSNLRRKLGEGANPPTIQNLRNRGYRLVLDSTNLTEAGGERA